jgi:hypothetical protein
MTLGFFLCFRASGIQVGRSRCLSKFKAPHDDSLWPAVVADQSGGSCSVRIRHCPTGNCVTMISPTSQLPCQSSSPSFHSTLTFPRRKYIPIAVLDFHTGLDTTVCTHCAPGSNSTATATRCWHTVPGRRPGVGAVPQRPVVSGAGVGGAGGRAVRAGLGRRRPAGPRQGP